MEPFIVILLIIAAGVAICALIAKAIASAVKKRRARVEKRQSADVVYVSDKQKPFTENKYEKRASLMTKTEKLFYECIQTLLDGSEYIVLPQIPLSAVIAKTTSFTPYWRELYHIVDFGIFDAEFRPLVLIEVNDSSHTRPDRQERDRKVRGIVRKASLPLITLLAEKGVHDWFIKKRLNECGIDI